jgi:outer membrane protein TolC
LSLAFFAFAAEGVRAQDGGEHHAETKAEGAAWAEPPPSPLPLAWALARAAAQSPAIAVSEALSDAARERIRPAGALDDPRFRYEASNVPTGDLDFDSTPLSGHQLGLSQRVPFPGLLSSREAAARARAEAAAFALENEEVSVASAVEIAWAELGFTQRALGITVRNIELLRQLAQIAEARYRVGAGLQQDVLRAQVELTALLDEELGRRAAIERASARLAALLDLSEVTRLPETEALLDDSPVPALSDLSASLEASNARLLALQAEIEEAERLVEVVKLEGYPDFDLGVGYRVRRNVVGDPVNGQDFIGASVTVRLPVNRGKWDARVAERHALLRRAEAAYRVERAALLGALRSAHADLTRADSESALLLTGLVPQARQSLASSRSGYEVGRIDFLSLLDSQVRSLNAELRLVRAEADRRQAFAMLEAALGETLR